MPLFSIVVPVYNTEKYLSKCLDSLINQTFKDIEIICVNDGSKDKTLSILEKYSKEDERIKIINKENEGLSQARNDGIKIATSPYIAFLDSDDYLEYDTLQKAHRAMIENDVDFVCWNIKKFYDDSKTTEISKMKFKNKIKMTEKIIRKTATTAWNKLYKTSIIKEKECLFPKGLLFEDNVFWLMYAPWAKFGFYIQDPFYNYRQRKGSITNTSKGTFMYLPLIKPIFEYYKKWNIEKKYKKLLDQRFNFYFKTDMENIYK